MNGQFHWLPETASTAAHRYDVLFFSVIGLMVVVAVAVFALMLWFSFKYRAGSRADRTLPPSGNRPLEIGWILTPLAIFIGIFVWAAYQYSALHDVPARAMPVFVVAKQWMWKLQHPDGRREIDELHVPVGQAVRLVMTSEDVIHSFYVPAFRVKQDVVPGRYTTLWFTPSKPGEYLLTCAEYCGTQHSEMRGRIVAMLPAEYQRWAAAQTVSSDLATRGHRLFLRLGCSGCHSPRSSVHAPDLTGLLGRRVHLQDGRTLVADDQYVRDSILLPRRDVVAGFEPIMPSFAGQVDEEEIRALIEYLRSTEPTNRDRTP